MAIKEIRIPSLRALTRDFVASMDEVSRSAYSVMRQNSKDDFYPVVMEALKTLRKDMVKYSKDESLPVHRIQRMCVIIDSMDHSLDSFILLSKSNPKGFAFTRSELAVQGC